MEIKERQTTQVNLQRVSVGDTKCITFKFYVTKLLFVSLFRIQLTQNVKLQFMKKLKNLVVQNKICWNVIVDEPQEVDI